MPEILGVIEKESLRYENLKIKLVEHEDMKHKEMIENEINIIMTRITKLKNRYEKLKLIKEKSGWEKTKVKVSKKKVIKGKQTSGLRDEVDINDFFIFET
jgi:hypothetical protein